MCVGGADDLLGGVLLVAIQIAEVPDADTVLALVGEPLIEHLALNLQHKRLVLGVHCESRREAQGEHEDQGSGTVGRAGCGRRSGNLERNGGKVGGEGGGLTAMQALVYLKPKNCTLCASEASRGQREGTVG